MKIAQKAIFSLLFSAFLIVGAAVLAHIGIFDPIKNRFFNPEILIFSQSINILMLVTVFLTVFLIIFFFLNFRKDSPVKIQEHIDSSGTVSVTSNNDDKFLAEAADKYSPLADEEKAAGPPELSDIQSAFGDDDENSGNAAELEEIVYKNGIGELQSQSAAVFFIRQPFTLPSDNPELLPEAEGDLQGTRGEVIVEQGGIHYVNSDAVNHVKNAGEKMDSDFVKLVESVVGA